MRENGEPKQNISFAEFELDTAHRRLLREGEPLSLYAKTFDLLVYLLEHNGQVVTKDQILTAVWEGQFVEEANLSVQISALRKVLGEKVDMPRFLVTVPGKGYKFVADLRSSDEENEIVIQKQTVTRVVVESESEVSDEISPSVDRLRLPPKPFSALRVDIRYLALVACILLLGLLAYYQWLRPWQTTAPIRSIAVLPFKPLVADSRDESLEMGMADTLIAKLSNVREINVRPVSAERKYADLDQDAVAAGREQKVDAVLDGQIQRSGDKVRMTVRLLRVADGTQIWTKQFDETMTDIFRVQDSISERVTAVLALKLTGEEREQIAKRHTENTEAYQLYLMGRYHLNRLTDDGFLKGRDYFQQAIDKDPNYAPAYAGLAESYNRLSDFNVISPREGFPKAASAAAKALELDENLAEAHTALGTVKQLYDWDWSAAESELRRAIEINPGNSDAREQYAFYLSVTGRFDESLAEMRHARELDPLSIGKITGEAEILRCARRYDQAIDESRKALEMDPNSGFAHWTLGNGYLNKGMYDEAIAEYQKAIPLSGESPDEPASLAYAYALSGRRKEALLIVDELNESTKRRYISPTVIAFIYGALGDKDQAFALLDKAYDGRDFLLVLLKVEPMFDPLRTDPRFTELTRRVSLPN